MEHARYCLLLVFILTNDYLRMIIPGCFSLLPLFIFAHRQLSHFRLNVFNFIRSLLMRRYNKYHLPAAEHKFNIHFGFPDAAAAHFRDRDRHPTDRPFRSSFARSPRSRALVPLVIHHEVACKRKRHDERSAGEAVVINDIARQE